MLTTTLLLSAGLLLIPSAEAHDRGGHHTSHRPAATQEMTVEGVRGADTGLVHDRKLRVERPPARPSPTSEADAPLTELPESTGEAHGECDRAEHRNGRGKGHQKARGRGHHAHDKGQERGRGPQAERGQRGRSEARRRGKGHARGQGGRR